MAYRRGRTFTAFVSADMAGEEIFQLENSPGGVHVFLGGDPGNRGLMHLNRLGDIREDQRFHGFFTLIQESLLVLDNTGRDFQQGLIAALQALDEPLGLLQLVAQVGVVCAAVRTPYK